MSFSSAHAFIYARAKAFSKLRNLFDYCTEDIDEAVSIKIDFSSCVLESGGLRHPLWPAFVSDGDDGVDLLLASKYTTNSSVSGIRKLKL